MNAIKKPLEALKELTLPMEFLPLIMAENIFYSVTERARKAKQDGEKGAVSVEQAIITIAVIAFALVVLGAISLVVKALTAQITTPTVPNGQ